MNITELTSKKIGEIKTLSDVFTLSSPLSFTGKLVMALDYNHTIHTA